MASGSSEQENATNPDARLVAPAPVPADVGIVAALSMEVGVLIDGLKRIRKYQTASLPIIEGEHNGKIVAIAIAGPGRTAARRATELLIAGHRPSWIISAGFAGALHPALNRNDLALPEEIIDLEGGRIPGRPAGVAWGRHPTRHGPSPHGRSADPRLGREGASSTAPPRPTWSTWSPRPSRRSASEKAVRFLSIRVISDDARTDLPREVAALLVRSGSYRVGAAVRAIWNRPSSLKDFWTLHERALEAADRLAKFVMRCLEDLPR